MPRSIAVPPIESLVHEVVCHDHDVAGHIPDPHGGLTGYERAVELALARIRNAGVPTRWSDASTSRAPSDPLPTHPDWSGGTGRVIAQASLQPLPGKQARGEATVSGSRATPACPLNQVSTRCGCSTARRTS